MNRLTIIQNKLITYFYYFSYYSSGLKFYVLTNSNFA